MGQWLPVKIFKAGKKGVIAIVILYLVMYALYYYLTSIPEVTKDDLELLHNTMLNSSIDHDITQDSKTCGQPKQAFTSEDLLCMPPPIFLPNYKNPCWKSDGILKCLPYFQLIGVDKSATTDLFMRLTRHPNVEGNMGYLGKETMWWSWRRYGIDLMRETPMQSFKNYTDYFKEAAHAIDLNVDTTGFHGTITGDGSPTDFWDFRGWHKIPQNADRSEPLYITPHLIQHVNPKVKFILLLRNPIDRLYSDFYFLPIIRKRNAESFHEAVSMAISLLMTCIKSRTYWDCLNDGKLHRKFNKSVRVQLGLYVVFLREWLSVFPREQFLILKYEDYVNNVPQYLNKVFKFLDLQAVSNQQNAVLGILNPVHENETKRKTSAEPMQNRTRQLLWEFYKPFNEHLAKLLSDERFLWNY